LPTSFAATAEKPSLSVVVLLQQRPSVYLRTALRALEDLKKLSSSDYSSVEVLLAHVGPVNPLARDSITAVLSSRVAFEDFKFIDGKQGDNEPMALNRFVKYQQGMVKLSFLNKFKNRAATQATGDFILFSQETVEILGSVQIQKMIEVFASSKGANDEIAVVGNKIIEDDGTIYSAGIDFIMAKNINKPDPLSSVNWAQNYNSNTNLWANQNTGRTRTGIAGGMGEQGGYSRLLGGRYGRNRNKVNTPSVDPEETTGGGGEALVTSTATETNATETETVQVPLQDTPEKLLSATEVPVLVHRLQGYNVHDSRVMSTQDVYAVSKGKKPLICLY